MIDAAEDTPSKISTGYSTPQIAIAVVLAIVLHGALVGVTFLSSSGKAEAAASTSTSTSTSATKPGDPNAKPSAAVTAENKDKDTDKLKPQGDEQAAPESKPQADDAKEAKKDSGNSQDSTDVLRLDTK